MVERIIWAVLADILSVRSRYSSHSAFQRLILRRWNKIKTSFWGFEDKPLFSSPHFEDLIRKSKRQNVALVAEYPPNAQNDHSVERQIYRVDKMSTRRWNRKHWGSVVKEKGSRGILPFSPFVRNLQRQPSTVQIGPLISSVTFGHLISPPGIHKEFLEKSRKLW